MVANPLQGTLRLQGQTPTVVGQQSSTRTPLAGTLRLVGQQPVLTETAHQYAVPLQGTLRLTGQQPTVSTVAAATAGPLAGTLRVEGQRPTVTVSTTVTRLRETPAGRARRVRRYILEIDGQEFVVHSAAEAQALLERARALASEAAQALAERSAGRAILRARVVGKAPQIELRPPTVTGPPELSAEVLAARAAIEQIYRDAAMLAEIRLLMAYMAERDEEEVLLLAM
jgi:hypothetical protein